MKQFGVVFFGLILGFVFPLLFILLSIVIWFYFDRDVGTIYRYIVISLFLGLLVDFKYLKSWINKLFALSFWFILGIYLFYHALFFGFFMGFPVFNVFLGIIAGYYYGLRIQQAKLNEKDIIMKVSWGTSMILFFVCLSSGLIALLSDYTASSIQGMFHLRFEITRAILWAIVIIGGATLVISEYYITKWTIIKTLKVHNKKAPVS